MGTARQKIQMELAFMAEGRDEAPMAVNKGPEVPMAKRESEDLALPVLLMEQICQRENLSKALQRVRQNKGSPGIDGMTVNKLPRYLKKHWPQIREQLLAGVYSPKPVKRVETPKSDGGIRKLGIPMLTAYCTSYNSVLEHQTDFTTILDELQTHSNNSFSLQASSLIQ